MSQSQVAEYKRIIKEEADRLAQEIEDDLQSVFLSDDISKEPVPDFSKGKKVIIDGIYLGDFALLDIKAGDRRWTVPGGSSMEYESVFNMSGIRRSLDDNYIAFYEHAMRTGTVHKMSPDLLKSAQDAWSRRLKEKVQESAKKDKLQVLVDIDDLDL